MEKLLFSKGTFVFLIYLIASLFQETWGADKDVELIEQVTTTCRKAWKTPSDLAGAASSEISVNLSVPGQTVDGFGACFNELGWMALSTLAESDRNFLMEELFGREGAHLTICRMPLGANDFSRNWYSYDEVPQDFKLKNFSIENDRSTLIPFIRSAQAVNPALQIWASPWCPPSWMKHNGHYASTPSPDHVPEQYRNDLPADKAGREGEDMFIAEKKYFKAYAKYFRKFIESYRKEGISIFGVMPQNEFNSAQVFPSCTWKASTLADFIGNYLGPEMDKIGVDVLFGTMERPDAALVDTVLQDPRSSRYVKGCAFQWAGKRSVGTIHRNYPEMKLYQSEQECGNGRNDWQGVRYSWDLIKHYFDNGVSVYDYWNIALQKGGISRWGWAQNSLIVTDGTDYELTGEYYLLKHFSHYVHEGACYLPSRSEGVESVAFLNPDRTVAVIVFNKSGDAKNCRIILNGKSVECPLAEDSVSTILLGL